MIVQRTHELAQNEYRKESPELPQASVGHYFHSSKYFVQWRAEESKSIKMEGRMGQGLCELHKSNIMAPPNPSLTLGRISYKKDNNQNRRKNKTFGT
jgi:hypothetical protein